MLARPRRKSRPSHLRSVPERRHSLTAAPDDLGSRLATLDRVALLIGWGLPLLGLLGGTRLLLESTDPVAPAPGAGSAAC